MNIVDEKCVLLVLPKWKNAQTILFERRTMSVGIYLQNIIEPLQTTF